ncbi:peptidylprolyl isomerase [Aquipuribacter hungaricus]|uniref:peptidylprolyl isomerase n=1 Tax=Aquipuribacter hungaricus TaxID=545624 RepID=A0ABV7WCH5_9MICO
MTSDRDRENARTRRDPGHPQAPASADRPDRPGRRNLLVGLLAALLVLAVVVGAALLGGGDDEAVGTEGDGVCPPGIDAVADPVQLDEVPPPATGTWTATLETTCGDVVLELDADAAPVGVGSFVGLVEAGFYDGTPCHRLTTQGIFVLQCGDPTGTGTGGPGYSYGPVENAPADDVYPAGTVAMARVGGDAESMGSQFFLVYEDSTIPSDAAGGYTVLGRITEGLEIVQQVADGGLAGDGVAPARSTGIVSVTAEETA